MWKRVGYIGVDSGQVIIGDPCYLDEWTDNDYNEEIEPVIPFSYDEACRITVREPFGVLGSLFDKHKGKAAVVRSGLGDGVYPVYARIEKKTVEEVVIDFMDLYVLKKGKLLYKLKK